MAGIALLVSIGPAAAQSMDAQPVRVQGRVVDARTGQPVAGAELRIKDVEHAVTDAAGQFVLSGLPPGDYGVVVRRLGYQPLIELWQVDAALGEVSIELEPDPVLIEGIRVTYNRFDRRLNAAGYSARAFRREQLAFSGAYDAHEWLVTNTSLRPVSCGASLADREGGDGCYLVRGHPTHIVVCIDDRPAFGGADELRSYRPSELDRVEVYAGGRHIKAYTTGYMERAARRRLHPVPLVLGSC